jgi:small subunit ribosomal protein S6
LKEDGALRLYEAMILIEAGKAKSNLEEITEEITKTIERFGGQIVNCEKWDERKLAYPVKRQRRGVYLLSHFTAPSDAIARVERAFGISENFLRVLITRDEDGTDVVPPGPARDEFGMERPERGSRGPRREGGGGRRDDGDRRPPRRDRDDGDKAKAGTGGSGDGASAKA